MHCMVCFHKWSMCVCTCVGVHKTTVCRCLYECACIQQALQCIGLLALCVFRNGVEELRTGIIGTPMAHYNKWTLLPLEDQDEDTDNNSS